MNYGKDYTGQRFGRLTAVAKTQETDSMGRFLWLFECDCGGTTITKISKVKSGHTNSCGCYQRERTSEAKTIHGRSHDAVYAVWKEMRQRCTNPKHVRYHQYGGRGITVCERWNTYENFLVDMGPRAIESGERLTIERINNDGNYEPSNCKWATYKEQRHNRTDTLCKI